MVSLIAKQTSVMRRFISIYGEYVIRGGFGNCFCYYQRYIDWEFTSSETRILIKNIFSDCYFGVFHSGVDIAIAVFVSFVALDRSLAGIYNTLGHKKSFLSGSVIVLVFALTIRFMAIGYNNIESGFSKMGKNYYEASKLLGRGEWQTFYYVDYPMLKPALVSAAILTFVDVIKSCL